MMLQPAARSSSQSLNLKLPSSPGTLKFALRASDGQLTSDPSEVVIDVENVAQSILAVAMTPTMAYTADNLKVTAQVSDADNDPLTMKYEWRRNGGVVSSQTSNTFPATLTTKNDVISVRVTASDGTAQATVDASTTILDSPPVLTANPPTTLAYGATASFTISASDADGDAIPLESDSYLSSSALKRYDSQLQLVHSTPLGVQANSLYVEESSFTRRNLLLSTTQGSYPTPSTNEIWAVDAQSGAEIWHSPALPGAIPLNSLQYADLHGDGKKAITFATSGGMFYTR